MQNEVHLKYKGMVFFKKYFVIIIDSCNMKGGATRMHCGTMLASSESSTVGVAKFVVRGNCLYEF